MQNKEQIYWWSISLWVFLPSYTKKLLIPSKCLSWDHFTGTTEFILKCKCVVLEIWDSLVAQMVKNLPAIEETWVWFLGLEDPQRREWLPTPVFSPGEFLGERRPTGYSPWGHRVGHNWATNAYTFNKIGTSKTPGENGTARSGRQTWDPWTRLQAPARGKVVAKC